jgi:hypothetical protein
MAAPRLLGRESSEVAGYVFGFPYIVGFIAVHAKETVLEQ